MGGRGAHSSMEASKKSAKFEWTRERETKKKYSIEYPIGEENKMMYNDTIGNLASIFPILEIKDIVPITVISKTVAGVAMMGVTSSLDPQTGNTIIEPIMGLAFNKEVFKTKESLEETIKRNFDLKHLAASNTNAIVVHEIAHILDFQLSIKQNLNISLTEFLKPTSFANATEAESRQGKLRNAIARGKRFSDSFPEALRSEMNINASELQNMVSEYSKKSPAEFFAESFAKWYCSSNKNGEFERAFYKILRERINKL